MAKELGDRIYPEQMNTAGRLNLRMHLSRYDWALSLLKIGGKTLDAGCGCGYGSRMLSWLSSEVVAVDRSLEAIEYARKYNSHPRIDCQIGDIGDIAGSDFDTVVAFEVLEHNDNSEELLAYLMARLKVGGHGFFSLPVSSSAPGHVRIFDYKQACELFSGYTGGLYYQRGVLISDRKGADTDIVLANLVKDKGNYVGRGFTAKLERGLLR